MWYKKNINIVYIFNGHLYSGFVSNCLVRSD